MYMVNKYQYLITEDKKGGQRIKKYIILKK